jgi:hypothetical protein
MQKSRRNSLDVLHLSHMRLGFTLSPDKVTITKGTAVGPLFGAAGKIDLNRDEVKLRGAMVPFFSF